jgi:hypothetical protein
LRWFRSPFALLAALLVAGQLSLLAACHELFLLWRARRGADTDLVVNLFALGIYLLVAAIPMRARGRTRGALAILLWPILGVALFARAIDWAIYFYGGAHLSVLALTHAEGAFFELLRGAVPVICVAVGITSAVAVVSLLVVALRRGDRARLFPFVLLGVALSALALFSGRMRRPRGEHASTNPEWALGRSVTNWLHERNCTDRIECSGGLRETTRRKLLRFGLRVAPKEAMPLLHANVFVRPHGLAHTADFVARRNLIIFFFESLSAEFVGAYRPSRVGITPNLDRFAAQSMKVSRYYNATTPTVVSLVSALCSFYPPSGHEQFGAEYYGALDCLSDVLRGRGWQPIFIRGIEQSYANVGPFLRSQGFEVHDRADLARSLREPSQSWGYSDPQLFRYARQLLETRRDPRPLLLAMTTVDLHAPYPMRPIPRTHPEPGGVLLDVVHASDEAFGEFWRWFETSPYAKDTIVVVTGDHAMFPNAEYASLRGPGWEKSYYDEIPLLIHDPGLALPPRLQLIAASSVDLTPTLLHLLDLDAPNSFEGTSLFDDRRGQVGVLGDQAGLLWTLQPDGAGGDLTRNFGLGDCDPAVDDSETLPLSICEQIEWHRWKESLVRQRRVWKKGLRY